MVVRGSPHLLGSFWVRPEHCSTRTCCHSCYSPPASKLRAQGWRSRAPFLSCNIESCLCLFSVLQNWQIIVLCHFLVITPDWKGCLTSRDVLCVRRSIRFVQRPFWSFFFFWYPFLCSQVWFLLLLILYIDFIPFFIWRRMLFSY